MPKSAFPPAFVKNMSSLLGSEVDSFFDALEEPAPTSIRKNPFKKPIISSDEKVGWAEQGIYLPERPSFTLDPLFHGGTYYVQETSSMFLEQAFSQHVSEGEPLKVLDLCAAPGGKSTHLASLINGDSLLVSNEVIQSRANILSENLQKWGTPNVVITQNDPSRFTPLTNLFDVILVDAPCSGEGLFRRDKKAVAEWSEESVKLCSQRQKRILMDVWPALKPGGVLIYSTCTYNRSENEENLHWLKEQEDFESLPITLASNWGVQEVNEKDVFAYRFFPHFLKGEGLFYSVLKKADDIGHEPNMRVKRPQYIKSKAHQHLNNDWLINSDDRTILERGQQVLSFQIDQLVLLNYLTEKLSVIHAGIDLGEVGRKEVIPSAALALSNNINRGNFTEYGLDESTALKYLKKEAIYLEGLAQGWVLVNYQDTPLGWCKHLGNRTNNYFPKPWRIRMDI
ncbi:MAG: rRNA methyltransferase [Bacteroidota bacterium]